jgi:hypothetical protein
MEYGQTAHNEAVELIPRKTKTPPPCLFLCGYDSITINSVRDSCIFNLSYRETTIQSQFSLPFVLLLVLLLAIISYHCFQPSFSLPFVLLLAIASSH